LAPKSNCDVCFNRVEKPGSRMIKPFRRHRRSREKTAELIA
jgi:hypothetical protein